MLIPVIHNVRGLIFVTIIGLGFSFYFLAINSKEKTEYEKTSGTVEYYDKEFLNLPRRHIGDYRYLKVDTYPFMFEIYEPNSESTENKIDDLKVGDKIDIYFYETSDTRKIQINRFAQFIDKETKPFFIRNGFRQQLGFVFIGLSLSITLLAFVLWMYGKLEW